MTKETIATPVEQDSLPVHTIYPRRRRALDLGARKSTMVVADRFSDEGKFVDHARKDGK